MLQYLQESRLEIDREVLKGCIDTILLSLLSEKPSYGYEMSKTVRENSGNEFKLKEATMYLALKRLENNGLVESSWGDGNGDGGRRKYYRILPEGSLRLARKREEWKTVMRIMSHFTGGSSS